MGDWPSPFGKLALILEVFKYKEETNLFPFQGYRMDVNIGDTVSLRLSEAEGELEGRLVGSEPPDFLIVRLPAAKEVGTVQPGCSLSAAYVNNGNAVTFTTTVLEHVPKFQIALIRYPETYESKALRKEARINCRIPATASFQQRALKGLVTDISNHGCQFIVKIPTRFKLYRVSVLTDIRLSLSFLEPSDVSQLSGKVRNTNIDEFKIVLGIEFDQLEEQLTQRLKTFISELDVLK
jgi:c-di-GMP-binding flagellar brake protein YcgR